MNVARSSKKQRPRIQLLCTTAALTWASLTHATETLAAGPARPEDVAAARALGVEGIQLADQGECAAAVERLARAEALYHAPTLLGRLGECQVQLGKLVSGTENLNRVVREQLGPDASDAFREAQERARRVLDEATPRIAKLTVRVVPAEAEAQLELDGVAVPAVLIGVAMPVDPGTRALVVRAAGFKPQTHSVRLTEGGQEVVTLNLTPDPTGPTSRANGSASQLSGEHTPSNRLPAYILMGVGGAGLAVGGVFGVLTLNHADKLNKACSNDICPESSRSTLDDARRDGMISTVALSAGAASAAVGLYWFFSSASPKSETSTTTLRLRPELGFGSASLSGSF